MDNAQFLELRFILGDDQRVGKVNKDELASKKKSINKVKESNTILGVEDKKDDGEDGLVDVNVSTTGENAMVE